jgi:hypothetical protein
LGADRWRVFKNWLLWLDVAALRPRYAWRFGHQFGRALVAANDPEAIVGLALVF